MSKLPDPFDLASLWRAFADPALGLEGLRLAYRGDLAFDLDIGLGRKFTFARGITLDAGLAVKVGVKRPGAFEFTLRARSAAATGGRTIIATLSRSETRERVAGGELGLELDLTSIAPRVRALLSEALGKWQEGLEMIKPFLSPGTWIAENLPEGTAKLAGELIAGAESGEALKADLALLVGRGAGDASLVAEWLGREIAARLDEIGLARLLADDGEPAIEQAAKEIAARITGLLPRSAPGPLFTALEKKLAEAIADQARVLRDKVKKRAEDILQSADPRALGRELARLGAGIEQRIDHLDAMLTAVRELAARYDALFRKVIAAAGDAARARLAATNVLEERRVKGTSYQFAGTFLDAEPPARRVFEALLRGRFQDAATVLGEDVPGFVPDREKCSLLRFTSTTSKLGYDLVLFGFGSSANSLLTGETKVSIGADGNVEVESRAIAQVTKRGPDETRSATFTCANSLLVARALADQPPAAERMVDLGLHFSHGDEKLTRAELDGILDSLVDAEFMGIGQRRRAAAVFDSWGGRGSSAKINALVELRLALGRSGVLALLDAGDGSQERVLGAVQRARIEAAYQLAREQFGRFEGDADDRREAADYIMMITHMRAIYFSRPAGFAGLAAAPMAAWSEEQYRDTERRIAGIAATKIRHLNRGFLPFKNGRLGKRLDHRFLTFIGVLKRLAEPAVPIGPTGAASQWAVTMVLTHRPRGRAAETMVLV